MWACRRGEGIGVGEGLEGSLSECGEVRLGVGGGCVGGGGVGCWVWGSGIWSGVGRYNG